jgi:MFS family permease
MTIAMVTLAIACAVRGLWSPCGLSMLSTITPLGERSRGHSYAWSMCWYLIGATAGGACLGACLSAGSGVLSAVGLPRGVESILTAVALVVGLAGDARLIRLPDRPRQVNERWLERYRPWAYSSGFGWQIGTGVATYVMTDATYALIVASMLVLTPLSALAMGTMFGLVRGACLLVGSSVTTPGKLRSLHARLARLAPWSVAAPTGAQLGILCYLAAQTGQPAAVAMSAVIGGGLGVVVLRHARTATTVSVGAP